MIDLVRHDWIRGIFERSLEGATFIPLSLYERPDLIENSWQSVLQEAKRPEHLLPPGTSITQVYDGAEGELLILGEPGSGKTILLLQLARDLLDRASLDEIDATDACSVQSLHVGREASIALGVAHRRVEC